MLMTSIILTKKPELWRNYVLIIADSQRDMEMQTIYGLKVSPNINPVHHRKTFD